MAKRKALSNRTRFEVFKRDKFTCQYCGAKAPDVVLQCDHIVAVALEKLRSMALDAGPSIQAWESDLDDAVRAAGGV